MENSNNITTPTSVLITINGSTLEITSLDTAIDGSMTKAGVWGFTMKMVTFLMSIKQIILLLSGRVLVNSLVERALRVCVRMV